MIYRMVLETMIQGVIVWLVRETMKQYKKEKREGETD